MLLCMGTRVSFVLDERDIDARASAALLHDQQGAHWPSCSLLVMPFERGAVIDTDETTKDARAFYGRAAKIKQGAVKLPPRALDEWDPLGELSEIYYQRRGVRAPGYFRHEFNRPRGLWKLIWPFKKAAGKPAALYAMLYDHGRIYRVELPKGCIVDDRGIVAP